MAARAVWRSGAMAVTQAACPNNRQGTKPVSKLLWRSTNTVLKPQLGVANAHVSQGIHGVPSVSRSAWCTAN
jgi:hypothetical protein